MGYPDLATLQEGGLGLWYSDNPDAEDEQVVVEPGFEEEFVDPGAYYIEVSSDSLSGSSPFTLNVSTG